MVGTEELFFNDMSKANFEIVDVVSGEEKGFLTFADAVYDTG